MQFASGRSFLNQHDSYAFLSGSNTLPPGTVIMTGTPHGVGMAQKPPRWLKAGELAGDSFEVLLTFRGHHVDLLDLDRIRTRVFNKT